MLRRKPVSRSSSNIWTGFVDILTALLLVLVFIITIFVLIQYVFSTEIQNLEGDKSDLTAVIKERDVRIISLDTRIEELLFELSELQTERDRLSSELDSRDTLIVILNTRIDEIISEVRTLQQERGKLNEDLLASVETTLILEGKVEEQQFELSELQSERDQLSSDVDNRDTLIVILNSRIDEIISEVRTLQQERRKLNEDLMASVETTLVLESKVEEQQFELNELQSERDRLSDDLDSRDTLIVVLNSRIDEIISEVRTLQQERGKLNEDLMASVETILILESRIEELLADFSELQSERDQLSSDVDNRDTLIVDLSARIDEINTEVRAYQEEQERLETEITGINNEGNRLRALIRELQAIIVGLQADVKAFELANSDNLATLGEKERLISDLSKQEQTLIENISKLELEISSIKQQRDNLAREREGLQNELDQKNLEHQEALTDISDLEIGQSNLNQLIETQQATIDSLQEEVTQLQGVNQVGLALIKEKDLEINRLREENKIFIEDRVRLEGEIAGSDRAKEQLEKEREDLVAEINRTNTEIQQRTSRITDLESDKSSLEEDISTLTAIIEGLRNDLQTLSSNRDENQILSNQVQELERRVATLLNEISALELNNENLKTEISGFEEQIIALQINLKVKDDSLEEQKLNSLDTQEKIDNLELELIKADLEIQAKNDEIVRLKDALTIFETRTIEPEINIEELSSELELTNIALEQALERIEEFKQIIVNQLGVLLEEDYSNQEIDREGIQQVAEKLTEFLKQYSETDEAVTTYIQDRISQDPSFGGILNASLANKVLKLVEELRTQEKQIAELELEIENLNNQIVPEDEIGLSKYKSQFLEDMLDIVEGLQGVEIVGDRFVFSTEVLFATSQAELSDKGKEDIKKVGEIINNLEIPAETRWVLRVDGHTDNQQIISGSEFEDNWELSQARALSVVRFLIDEVEFDPEKLAATGFGEYQPVGSNETPEERANNRRIELKLTEP